MSKTRRSKLQKAIIEAVRNRYCTDESGWKSMEGISTQAAWNYSMAKMLAAEGDAEAIYDPFVDGADGESEILSVKFKVSFDRSFRSLVEQGMLEVRSIGTFTMVRLNPELQGTVRSA